MGTGKKGISSTIISTVVSIYAREKEEKHTKNELRKNKRINYYGNEQRNIIKK